MVEYEIGRLDKVELINKELNKQVSIIEKAFASGKKAQWDLTFAVAEIIDNELWEDDFDTQKDFASYMNLSNASISQYKGAVRFITATGANPNDISVGNAYLLSTMVEVVEDKNGISYNFSEYLEFEKYCTENEIDLLHLTQTGLKQAIKDFRNPEEATEEATDESTEEATEETTEEVTEEATEEATEEENVVIVNGIAYEVTEKQLKAIKKALGI